MMTTALNFKGSAEKALNFYSKVFGYTVREKDVHKWENGLIAHAEIMIHGNKLMLADTESDNTQFAGFSLSINLTDQVELKKDYDALNVNAEILMPLQKTDWSESYGLLKDQFGVTWQFNLD